MARERLRWDLVCEKDPAAEEGEHFQREEKRKGLRGCLVNKRGKRAPEVRLEGKAEAALFRTLKSVGKI